MLPSIEETQNILPSGLSTLFSFDIPDATWILLGILLLAVILCLSIGWHPQMMFASTPVGLPAEDETENPEEEAETPESIPEATASSSSPTLSSGLPKMSVIVFAQAEEEGLECCLNQLVRQDYPDFEIIVVCDGTHESARILSEHFTTRYPGVYITFIPPGSHNLSRRKLAFTLGIKAAKGDVVLTTESNILIPSRGWLADMARPFANRSVCVALGATRMDFSELTGPWRWYRQFDSTMINSRWIGHALNGDAYRGDGFNLAFRREIFFQHKGYAGSTFLHVGDDDLFVQEIASGRNAVAVTGLKNLLTTYWYDSANRVWSLRKARYSFTSRWLRKGPFVRAGFASLCQWLTLLLAVAASIVALPSLIGLCCALIALLIFWGVEIAVYRKVALRLGSVRLFWALPIFLLARPLVNAIFRFDHRESNRKIFTWQR